MGGCKSGEGAGVGTKTLLDSNFRNAFWYSGHAPGEDVSVGRDAAGAPFDLEPTRGPRWSIDAALVVEKRDVAPDA